jgi:hypothetical protein
MSSQVLDTEVQVIDDAFLAEVGGGSDYNSY